MNPTQVSKSEVDLSSSHGFTMIEVVIAFALTTIVLGAIFGLLAQGMRTAPAEAQRADLQAQARHALDQMGRDILLAGAHLPPEFPAFTPFQTNPPLPGQAGSTRSIEIVGDLAQNTAETEPIPVVSFDGYVATLAVAPTQLEPGDLVLFYDDQPTNGRWVFGLVSSIELGPSPRLTLKTMPGAQQGDITLPPFIDNYNRPLPTSGFITPVTVVTYSTSPVADALTGGPSQTLWRQVNWGPAIQMAQVEDLQIRYFVSDTIDELTVPTGPSLQIQRASTSGPNPPSWARARSNRLTTPPPQARAVPSLEERELVEPPIPQPNPAELMQPTGLVRGVRVSVTTRSQQANLVGSAVRPGQSLDEDGYLRVTFSSRIATRNLLFGTSTRENLDVFN